MPDLPPPPEPPAHVIIIQADDLGYDDLGVHGNLLIQTPHLDRLASESITAKRFSVNPVCAASRASLMTGRHYLRTGVSHVHGGKDFLHRNEQTLGNVFQEADWETGTWGKWHLGHTEGYYPWQRGFDEAFMATLYQHEDANGLMNGERLETDQWADELIFDMAIDFLDQHRDVSTFLYITTMTPHTPLVAPAGYIQPYREMGLSEPLSTLYGMITYLDVQVGRLLEYLEQTGLADNTLVIFLSDNGPAVSNGILSDEDRAIRKTSARRGWKGDIWENGVRSPLFIRWPAQLEPRVILTPIDQVDLYPTLLELCGIELPAGQLPLDGRSLAQALLNGAEPEATPIFNYAHPGWITSSRPYTPVGIPGEYNPVTPEEKQQLEAREQPITITLERYKLLYNPFPPETNPTNDDRFMLVDIVRDPGETTDVKATHAEIFGSLASQLEQWYAGITAAQHSYTAPYFPIDGAMTIPAKTVSDLSDTLQNTVFFIQGWAEEGQFAEYQIEVARAETFTARLEWLEPYPPQGLAFSISDGHNRTTGVTDGSAHTALGTLKVGRAAATLRVTLEDAPFATRDARLSAIQLLQP